MEKVVVRVEAWLPRTYKKNGEYHLTKKKFRAQVMLGRWPVVYRDRDVIVVKQFGAVCIYHSDGQMALAGYNVDHPQAHLIPKNHGRWSLVLDSIKALKPSSSVARVL
jgi:hypothetical protein